MKKIHKGLISALAGAALLAGTAGTFALWYDTAAMDTATDQIQTGDLRIKGEGEGSWKWVNVSQGTVPTAAFVGSASELVPGDGVQYVWGSDDIELIKDGDTLLANLYLDGVQVAWEALAPLVVVVGTGDEAVVVDAQLADSVGGLVISGVETTDDVAAALPIITIGFPLHYDSYGEPDPVAPTTADTNAWGRNIDESNVLNLAEVEIRLQQVPDLSTVFTVPAP